MERATKKNWKQIKDSLPLEMTKEGIEERNKLFKLFDINGSGTLAINEIHTGIRHNLKLDEVIDCKPAIQKAFDIIRHSRGSKSKLKSSDTYIISSEFKRFLIYLRQYFEYYEMFDRLDSDSNKKIDFYEFKAAIPTVEKWGLIVENPEASFAELDRDKSGYIIFDEFCSWAIEKSLDIEDDDDFNHQEIVKLSHDEIIKLKSKDSIV